MEVVADNKVRFSIVIPTRACPAHLSTTIEKVLETTEHLPIEVIVAVNGSKAEVGPALGVAEGYAKLSRKIIVEYVPKAGFTHAVNAGFRRAKGECFILLQDDTLPTTDWLQHLVSALQSARAGSQGVKWGLVGAVTNRGAVIETVQDSAAGVPANAEKVAADLMQQEMPPGSAIPAGGLSGTCLLVLREVYEAVGSFDPRFEPTGGLAVADYCLRAQAAGYSCCVAPHAFVFHYGAATLNRLGIAHENGNENLPVLIEKHRPKDEPVVMAAYVVQLRDVEDLNWFLSGLKHLKDRRIVEGVTIVDSGSAIDILPALQEHFGDFVADVQRNFPGTPPDVARDRSTAINMARALMPDWILSLVGTERLDPSVTRADLQRLVRPVNPMTRAYICPVFPLYRGMTHVRADGPWGDLRALCLFKNDPGWGDMLAFNPQTTLLQRVPTCLPQDAVAHTMVLPLLSVQASRPELLVGGTADTIPEVGLTMLPYRKPEMTFLVMGRNEDADLIRQFVAYRDLFTDFVYVDTGSTTSRAATLIEALGGRVAHFRCCEQATDSAHMLCDFAAARNFAIDQVRTPYCLFLDPDEELDDKGLAALMKLPLEHIDGWMMTIKNLQQSPKGVGSYDTTQLRMFRIRPELRFDPEEKIHETLETALMKHPELEVGPCPLTILHYGFLKTDQATRAWRNSQYATRMEATLAANPKDAKALFGLGVHRNAEGRTEEGDNMLARALQEVPSFFAARLELELRMLKRAFTLVDQTPAPIPADGRGQMLKHIHATLKGLLQQTGQLE